MIVAILALPFCYAIAQWIDLPLSVWILQNLWAVILLVLVIIFQQEIREVLGRITLPTFLLGEPEVIPLRRLDRIAEAAFSMAKEGMGGLIVLQQRDDLDEFIQGKTLLDWEISEGIILSIFNPPSPLHDGAIIIRGDRIRYATALLPVSNSASLPKEWGTRHRAGVGITEVSDAECIIISEQRKEVLFAHRGKVEKKECQEDLIKSSSELPSFPEEKIRVKRWMGELFSDLYRKAFFLLIVCLLWIFVVGIRKGEVSFNIPVEYYSIPQNLIMVGEPPREINVRFRGSQRLLSSIKPDHIRVEINLSNARSGMNQISLSEKNINTPSGIIVTNFYPRNIKLQLSPISKSNYQK
jgi:DNA integrity scanning protein DisA with diadenylate cyclase activity